MGMTHDMPVKERKLILSSIIDELEAMGEVHPLSTHVIQLLSQSNA
jgi:hypothetical protein